MRRRILQLRNGRSCSSASRPGHHCTVHSSYTARAQCEIWSDIAGKGHDERTKYSIRTLIKGVNDEIDPAKILMAFAHPLMFRRYGFAVMDGFPKPFAHNVGAQGGYYSTLDEIRQDLPEGTIYLEGISTSYNRPDAHEELKGYLRELGLLAE